MNGAVDWTTALTVYVGGNGNGAGGSGAIQIDTEHRRRHGDKLYHPAP